MSRNEPFAKRGFAPKCILITGASGGIGAALAVRCAQPGVTLFLWGRNLGRLEEAAEACRKRGAITHIRGLDLSDSESALAALRQDDEKCSIDFLILGAGVPDIRPETALTETPEIVLQMARVNFATPITLATEMAARMALRGGGNIVAIGSVAAFHDLPLATAYSGSKAGLTRFMTALHAAMTPNRVIVTVLSPGYIDTAMSRRLEGARPFLMTPDAAAKRILAATRKGRAHVMFPWPFVFFRWLEAVTPRPIAHALLRLARMKQRPLDSSPSA